MGALRLQRRGSLQGGPCSEGDLVRITSRWAPLPSGFHFLEADQPLNEALAPDPKKTEHVGAVKERRSRICVALLPQLGGILSSTVLAPRACLCMDTRRSWVSPCRWLARWRFLRASCCRAPLFDEAPTWREALRGGGQCMEAEREDGREGRALGPHRLTCDAGLASSAFNGKALAAKRLPPDSRLAHGPPGTA